jgi:hypothetical protein
VAYLLKNNRQACQARAVIFFVFLRFLWRFSHISTTRPINSKRKIPKLRNSIRLIGINPLSQGEPLPQAYYNTAFSELQEKSTQRKQKMLDKLHDV